MSYKRTDVMAVVQAIKKLGWNFTYANETFDGDRRNLKVNFYKLEKDPEAWREEYRKKQAAGVKFERRWGDGTWNDYSGDVFVGFKEDYREVPQEVFASECQKAALEHLAKTYSADKGTAQLNPTIPPHAAERALWKAQREAGTNEVWQARNIYDHGPSNWADLSVYTEPQWAPKAEYCVKPMKLTAKICRVGKAYPMSYIGQDWEFTGNREEYRAECEKYGYVVVSNIEEVKPKTVTYYFVLFKTPNGRIGTGGHRDKQKLTDYWVKKWGYTIIGDIESREVEV